MNTLAGRYICFTLGKDQYAIPLLQVKEVIGMVATTPIPQAPSHFIGIMNLRGQVISVLNLSNKLKLNRTAEKKDTTIIILEFANSSFGVAVNSVDSVITYTEEEISLQSEFEVKAQPGILGVAKKDKTLTLLLDLKEVLNLGHVEDIPVAA